MIGWIVANWLDLVVGAAVLLIIVLCVRNLLPGKGSPCAGCSGACGSCGGGCSGCGQSGTCPSKK